jgi:hypothetical protein
MSAEIKEESQIGGWKVQPKNNVKQPVANKAPVVAAPVVAAPVPAPVPAPAPGPGKHKSKSAKKSKSNTSKSNSNSNRNNFHSFASILAGGSGASVEDVKRLLQQLT